MDHNSRISWHKGSPINAELVNKMMALEQERQENIIKSISYSKCGIMPHEEFLCKPVFCGRNLVIERLLCKACLASGAILDIDQRVELPFPTLLPGEYYLVAGFGKESQVFESKGIEFYKPIYEFGIKNLEELKQSDVIPLVKFHVSAKGVSIDIAYIAPFVICGSDERILERLDHVVKLAHDIANHPHIRFGIDQRTMQFYEFMLRNVNRYDSIITLYARLKNYLLAQHFHVFQSNGREGQVPDESLFFLDINAFFDLLGVSQESALMLLDSIQPVDDKIDLEKLKAEIKEELKPVIKEELTAEIKPELHDQLVDELKTKIKEELMEEFRPLLIDKVVEEVKTRFEAMRPEMHDILYRELYDALFADLKLCKPIEEDNFMPDI